MNDLAKDVIGRRIEILKDGTDERIWATVVESAHFETSDMEYWVCRVEPPGTLTLNAQTKEMIDLDWVALFCSGDQPRPTKFWFGWMYRFVIPYNGGSRLEPRSLDILDRATWKACD